MALMKSKAIGPSTVAKEFGSHLSSTSRGFAALKKRGLIFCLDESSNNFRLYQLTQQGKKALKKADSL